MKIVHTLYVAQMFPREFPYLNEPERWAEMQVFNTFAKLEDPWSVFYGVAWQAIRNGRQGDGECDFVLAHPRHGIYAVEVKGGSEIGIEDGVWFTAKRGTRIPLKESPFEQAVRSKNVLKDYLAQGIGQYNPAEIVGHFVVFPSHSQDGDISPEGRREIICDENDLANFSAWLPKLLAHWAINANYSADLFNSIKRRLAPSVTMKNSISVRIRNSEEALIDLTQGQFEAMEQIRRHRRSITLGGAGTGKTLLAKSRAEYLADAGFRTLLICFNKPLGDVLNANNDRGNLIAGSFHSVCLQLAEKARTTPDGERNSQWWDSELPVAFQVASDSLDLKFDAIIVDEAQDFLPDWWDALFDVLSDRKDAIFAIFADSNQNIYREEWKPPFDVDPTDLNVNCRNTIEIAMQFSKLAGSSTATRGIHGVMPTTKIASTDNQVSKALAASVELFLGEARISPKDVVVLVNRKSDADLATSILQEIGGDAAEIRVETIQRFKGLEAVGAVVLLREIEPSEFNPIAYVGLSRARSMLHVICTEDILDQLKEIAE